MVQVDPDQADHREVRRAAGRAALVAGPAADGQLRRGGGERPADGDFRGSRSRVWPRRARHEAPKQPPGGGNPFMQQRQPPQPKGDISQLWKLLGVDFGGDNVVWQDYNPYPKCGSIPHEWVFVDHGSGAKEPFNPNNPDHLQAAAGVVPVSRRRQRTELLAAEVHRAGRRPATAPARFATTRFMERNFMGQPRMNPEMPLLERPTNEQVRAGGPDRGKLKPENMPMSDKGRADEARPRRRRPTTASRQGRPSQGRRQADDAAADKATDPKPRPTPRSRSRAAKAEPEINVVAGRRHRLPVRRVLQPAGPRRGSRDGIRVPFRQRAVRAQRARHAGRRRAVRRHPHAAAVAPHVDEGQRSHRKRPQGGRPRAREVQQGLRDGPRQGPARNSTTRSPSWQDGRASTGSRPRSTMLQAQMQGQRKLDIEARRA